MIEQVQPLSRDDDDDDSAVLIAPDPRTRVVALIPAYNEERCIGSVILRTLPYVDEVIVVDDGSRDATALVAAAAGAQLIQHSVNKGKGQALTTGFRAARKLRPDVVVILDSDGQHSPDEIPLLLSAMREHDADMVVGSRFTEPAQLAKIPGGRRVGLKAVTTVTNLLSGVVVSDSQSGFRAFSARALKDLTFQGAGFSVESEMQFLAREHRHKVVEVAISADYADPAKRSPVMQGLGVIDGVMRLVGQTRPLLFMGVPGLFLLVLGLLIGLDVVAIYAASQRLAVGYALLSIMCVIIGAMTLFSGVILHSVRALLVSMRAPMMAETME